MNSRNVNNMAGGPSAGPTPIEAAAEAIAPWLTFQGEPTWPEKVAVHVIETWVRAAVGCPTCKGTRVWKNDADMVHEKCPKEHVRLTVLGETIYADRDKCEWRCNHTARWATGSIYDNKPGTNDCDPEGFLSHRSCGVAASLGTTSRRRMMDETLAEEGPFTDTDGNQCLGVWANEGGVLLVLQRRGNAISFHAMSVDGEHHNGPATVASFRYQRVLYFIAGGE